MEIFISECCGLCENFSSSIGGAYNSVRGRCGLSGESVWSHNVCDDVILDKDLISEFDEE